MDTFPHHYAVEAVAKSEGNVTLSSADLEPIESAAPAEFGGPGDRWSPETLLVASVADCFILSFKAIARNFKFEWQAVTCEVDGVLDRVDGVTRFTEMRLQVVLTAPQGTDMDKAQRLLEKAEKACLITNSLKSESHLRTEVLIAE
tara:strand:- start:6759 stop:7196 length:438 start_codon:yes stop_codon:yes gene_type:complete